MRNKKLKQIDIVLENCEVITIPVERISNFYFKNITTNYWFDETDSEIDADYATDEFYIILPDEANIFLKADYQNIFSDYKIFDRLTEYQDITHIDLIFTDGTSQYIAVPYEEENPAILGSPNLCQKSHILDNGDLEIFISSNKESLDDFNEISDIARKEGSE